MLLPEYLQILEPQIFNLIAEIKAFYTLFNGIVVCPKSIIDFMEKKESLFKFIFRKISGLLLFVHFYF
jgi:hypothetical protein